MEKIINADNIKNFAYVNDAVCRMPIRGVALNFFGLGNMQMFGEDTADGKFYGENGILYVTPYTNPWAWMSPQTVAFTDELLDVLFAKYNLGENTPVVSTGESMGGQSALVYCVYAKRTPVACVANCPVCDTFFHYTERDDLPRTMYSALFNCKGSLQNALKSVSPVHLIDRMPKITYCIFHCENDRAVNIEKHSNLFVDKMRNAGHDVSYFIVPDRGHCDIGETNKRLFAQYVADAINRNGKTDL